MIAICTHEPNEAGTACRFCGLAAVPVGAAELELALTAELAARGLVDVDPASPRCSRTFLCVDGATERCARAPHVDRYHTGFDDHRPAPSAATPTIDGRLPHCTPSAFSGHSPLCDRDGRFCSMASTHAGPCSPHGRPRVVVNALELCNACDVNPIDPASPAGYCSTCEAEARTFDAPAPRTGIDQYQAEDR